MPVILHDFFAAVEAGEPPQGPGPESALAILEQRLDEASAQTISTVRRGNKIDDPSLSWFQVPDPCPTTDPEGTISILTQRSDDAGTREPKVLERAGPTGVKHSIGLVGPAESSIPGADPECPVTRLQQRSDQVVAQAIRRAGIMTKMCKVSCCPVQSIQSATPGSDPEHPISGLTERMDTVIAQAARIGWVIMVPPELPELQVIRVEPASPAPKPEPA